MTTSRSEAQRKARIEQIKRYVEEVCALTDGVAPDCEVTRPPGGRAGEVQIKLIHKNRTEVWRMTLCSCCDPPLHEGWYLASSGAVS